MKRTHARDMGIVGNNIMQHIANPWSQRHNFANEIWRAAARMVQKASSTLLHCQFKVVTQGKCSSLCFLWFNYITRKALLVCFDLCLFSLPHNFGLQTTSEGNPFGSFCKLFVTGTGIPKRNFYCFFCFLSGSDFYTQGIL